MEPMLTKLLLGYRSRGGYETVALRCRAWIYPFGEVVDGHAPITFGIADNDEDRLAAISALLNAGADLQIPNNKGMTALHVACFQGTPQVAELLLEAGVDANTESTVVNLVKPLDYAMLRPANAAREKIVELLQARGGQPKISRKGQSEVMIASKARKNNCRCQLSSRTWVPCAL